MFVDPSRTWRSICGDGNVDYFWASPNPQTGQRPANYHGDGNLVANSASTVDWSEVWGGLDLETWQNRTQQDTSSLEFRNSPDWTPEAVVERARKLLQSTLQGMPTAAAAASEASISV